MLKSAAVIRTTFTSNARNDADFRDYLRSLKSQKITNNTWDIPFAREEDIDIILETLKKDFGYPIQILEIIESPEINTDGRRYEMYALSCVRNIKLVEKVVVDRKLPNLHLAARLNDIVSSLEEKRVKANTMLLRQAAQNIKVYRQFVIAALDDMYQYGDNVGIDYPEQYSQMGLPNCPCKGQMGVDGIINIQVSPAMLEKLLCLFQKPAPAPEQPAQSFEYVPQDSMQNQVLAPVGTEELRSMEDGSGYITENELEECADVANNPQSDVGGLRNGVESGPLESNILEYWRTTGSVKNCKK